MHTTKLIRHKKHKHTMKHTKKRKSIAEHGITLKIGNHKLTKTINNLNKEITNKLHDKLFQEANKKIDNGENNNDAADIYLYLHKNKYNPDNIGKWLLHNSPDYKIRKYYFNLLDKDNKINDEDRLKFYVDLISNKTKYNLDMKYYPHCLDKINKLMDIENVCNKIDLFIIMYYSDFTNNNFFNHIKYFCNTIQPYDKIFQPTLGNITTDKLTNLGIYTLYNQSPAFKHCVEVLSYLSGLVDITLYIEGTEIDTKYDKYIKDRNNLRIELIGGKTDEEVINLIKSNNHIFLIFIYGFFKRRNVVLAHPAKYTFHYLDAPTLYSNHIYDYNIIDKYNYNYPNLNHFKKIKINKI